MTERRKAPGRVSMRDIAAAVGTSAVTVSKALTGKPGMSDALRSRIVQTAKEMGYQYPGGERMLSRGHLDIGILVPEKFFEPDSYYSVLYKKLVQKLAEQGHFGLLEIVSPEREQDGAPPNLLQTGHVDGIVLLGQPRKSYFRMIEQWGVPTLYLDFYDEHGTADAVVGDNTYGAYRLTSHLIRNGHTRIGFVGNLRATSSIMDRYLGYYRAMWMNHLEVRPEWTLSDRADDGVLLLEVALPEELPTALVCNCDLVARRVIDQLNARGLRVPEDISVTGFDDYEVVPEGNPPLSTFRVDRDGMIDLAVRTIVERCEGQRRPCGRLVVGGQPIYRGSERALEEAER